MQISFPIADDIAGERAKFAFRSFKTKSPSARKDGNLRVPPERPTRQLSRPSKKNGPLGHPRTRWMSYPSYLVWERLEINSVELADVAEHHEVYRKFSGLKANIIANIKIKQTKIITNLV